jgi:hypothetical protein
MWRYDMPTVAQLLPLLGSEYEAKCVEFNIIQRKRKIETPADLMLLCLLHLINGCSLVDISEIARLSNIADISDVALMKKFGQCAPWFQSISENLIKGAVTNYAKPAYLEDYRVIAFDASDVAEKGRSGRSYRLHYGIDIFTMSSVDYKITEQRIGETLRNFKLEPGDLAVADRIYGTLVEVSYCIESEADYIFRLRAKYFNMYDEADAKIDMLSRFEGLESGESRDVHGYAVYNGKRIPIRVCVMRKSKEAIVAAQKRLNRKSSKKQEKISDSTRKFNEYIVVATSLGSEVSADDILETYRYRWQVECYFKRLKSIMDVGELPKKLVSSSLSWINGKIMVALMIEMIISQGSFSPRGFFGYETEYLEGDEDDTLVS